jgi:4-hydroxythreonine-4-phosphate dehydrogenase
MTLALALTMGEPAGIGSEIALRAWLTRREHSVPAFFLIDDPARLARLAHRLGWEVPLCVLERPEGADTVFESALPILPLAMKAPVAPGKPDPANALAVLQSIDIGVTLVQAGRAAALVTNPIQKETMYAAGFKHPGHTEYLAERTGVPVAMMLACPGLRVVPVTIHKSLKDALASLTSDGIVAIGKILSSALIEDFAIKRPRIAVAGLNPHAGESGALGREEIDIVEPAVARLRAAGIAVEGPAPADTLFHAAARARYDAVLCLYHDQALIPLKTIDFDGGVNITLGLPFIRTSPDHGTALDIAGTGTANPASLVAALKLAGELAAVRAMRHSSA